MLVISNSHFLKNRVKTKLEFHTVSFLMHSVYHFYLVNQPNFVFIIFKISCSCALYSLHLECNLYPHLVIEIIIYILFRRYILISMIPILTNTNNTIKFTSRYSLITSPSTAIPERLPSKNI